MKIYLKQTPYGQRFLILTIHLAVLKLLEVFQKVNKIKVKYSFAERREGDLGVIFADNSLAYELLNWLPKRTIDDMCRDAWKWKIKNIEAYKNNI